MPSSLSRNGGTNTPESNDKVYCTHWIRHGECDYIQQGCRYKHEMPNRATLQSIGFRTVPRWWQEKVAVQLGQSAKPIVGDGKKPSEWMKLDSGDEDSESNSESDSGSDGSEVDESEGEDKSEKVEKLVTSANTMKALYSGAATEPMMDQSAKTVTLPPFKEKSTAVLPTAETPQRAMSTKSIRRPSLTGSDLIDFSPADPTCEIVYVTVTPSA